MCFLAKGSDFGQAMYRQVNTHTSIGQNLATSKFVGSALRNLRNMLLTFAPELA
jgi:hypothetical protein